MKSPVTFFFARAFTAYGTALAKRRSVGEITPSCVREVSRDLSLRVVSVNNNCRKHANLVLEICSKGMPKQTQ